VNLHVKSDDYAYRFTEVPGVSLRPFYNAYGQMDSTTATIEADLDSLSLEEERFEGTKKSHLSNYFERNPSCGRMLSGFTESPAWRVDSTSQKSTVIAAKATLRCITPFR